MLHHTPIVVISGPSMFWGVKKKNNIFLEVTKKKKKVQLLFLLFVNEKRTSPFFEWNGYKESENKYIY